MKRVKSFMISTLLLLAVFLFSAPPVNAATTPTTPVYQPPHVDLWKGKSTAHYDPNWLKKKLAHQITRPGRTVPPGGVPFISAAHLGKASPFISAAPLSKATPLIGGALLTEYPNLVGEPYAWGTDVNGDSYSDAYMWYLCGPGASTETLRFWLNTDTMPANWYRDPTGWLKWDVNNERTYVMYMATATYPPAYHVPGGSPGEMTYGNPASNSYTGFYDLANAVNWEASGETSGSFAFYAVVGGGNLDLATLRHDAETDIFWTGVPFVASVNVNDLPDWNVRSGTSHFVSVIGYDNNNDTFTYTETCGASSAGCNTAGFGYYSIRQEQLLQGIYDAGGNGGIVW